MTPPVNLQFQGRCLCGDFRITATGKPDRVGICHCLDCQKYHGATFYAAAVFAQDAVTLSGETRVHGDRYCCAKCGSPAYAKSDREIEVYLGLLPPSEALTPTYELWTIRRAPWLPAFAYMTQHARDRVETDAD